MQERVEVTMTSGAAVKAKVTFDYTGCTESDLQALSVPEVSRKVQVLLRASVKLAEEANKGEKVFLVKDLIAGKVKVVRTETMQEMIARLKGEGRTNEQIQKEFLSKLNGK